MRLEQFRSMFPDSRSSGPGFVAHCPACQGRRQKLSAREGEKCLLVKCWAACSLEQICAALGIKTRELFFDSDIIYRQVAGRRNRPSPKPRRLDWRRTSADLMNHSDALWLRASIVLTLGSNLPDVSVWSEDDLDAAINAVGMAYADLERADLLEAAHITCE